MITMTRAEVVEAVGMGAQAIAALEQYELFPAQVKKGVWSRDAIAQWMLDDAYPGEMPLDVARPICQTMH